MKTSELIENNEGYFKVGYLTYKVIVMRNLHNSMSKKGKSVLTYSEIIDILGQCDIEADTFSKENIGGRRE